ncbi:hypothetical protein [Cellvibrio polysaccharolyticus]|uniref:Uncharacterized protein n=1 Tax=Cellvibrio polysaccharolyticus TaxID=2082724 RepID=A0A928V4P6_9GAMM|nr:hypothetical protein [Cellvibrio polysaccharolyticus]MBE8716074.1 hypothetical protein [Cellvibrio polysaccharolyticus]
MKNLACLLLALCFSAVASAADYSIVVSNKSGYDFYHLYVSSVSSEEWEEDILGVDVLPSGEKVTVTISGFDSPHFDIRAVDEEGDTFTLYDIDVEKYDVVFTLEAQD